MRWWAIKFSDGRLGEPRGREDIYAAFESIAADRRALCSIICLEEVADGERETMRPAELRATQETLTEET